jgi:hypothetical protein
MMNLNLGQTTAPQQAQQAQAAQTQQTAPQPTGRLTGIVSNLRVGDDGNGWMHGTITTPDGKTIRLHPNSVPTAYTPKLGQEVSFETTQVPTKGGTALSAVNLQVTAEVSADYKAASSFHELVMSQQTIKPLKFYDRESLVPVAQAAREKVVAANAALSGNDLLNAIGNEMLVMVAGDISNIVGKDGDTFVVKTA